jgi:hypothetical protein
MMLSGDHIEWIEPALREAQRDLQRAMDALTGCTEDGVRVLRIPDALHGIRNVRALIQIVLDDPLPSPHKPQA